MGAYHQMGYQTDKYLVDEHLADYEGLILSPVNYQFEDLRSKTAAAHTSVTDLFQVERKRRLEVIFDPQMYIPRAARGELSSWSYYPQDLETADLFSPAWWKSTNQKLIDCASRLEVDAICSPAFIPRHDFSPDYFANLVTVGTDLSDQLGSRMRAIQTAIVGMAYLATDPQRPKQTASILTKTPCAQVYLVLHVNAEVRRELADDEQLSAAMQLIKSIEGGNKRVIVAFSSSDVVLWKAAGATHCATGKNLNVRRFTANRFADEEASGGAQQPYFFEEGLLAFLRRVDVGNLKMSWPELFETSRQAHELNRAFIDAHDDADLTLGWRQFLWWFMTTEGRLTKNPADASKMVQRAKSNWATLHTKVAGLAEEKNDGRWIQPWEQAIASLSAKK